MPRGTRKPKAKKSKRVAYQVIPFQSKWGEAMYPMLNKLVEEHHEELTNARIALAWALAWKPDTDGHVKLGQCKKRSDLDREFEAFDFVIVLRQEFWQSPEVKDAQRVALLDHELCHATVRLDREGEPLLDERGRRVYRTRKHDIEEFAEVVQRHGLYKRDLERFASALRRSKQGNLPLDETAPERVARDPKVRDAIRNIAPKAGSGITSVTIGAGKDSVTLTQEDRKRMDAEARGRA